MEKGNNVFPDGPLRCVNQYDKPAAFSIEPRAGSGLAPVVKTRSIRKVIVDPGAAEVKFIGVYWKKADAVCADTSGAELTTPAMASAAMANSFFIVFWKVVSVLHVAAGLSSPIFSLSINVSAGLLDPCVFTSPERRGTSRTYGQGEPRCGRFVAQARARFVPAPSSGARRGRRRRPCRDWCCRCHCDCAEALFATLSRSITNWVFFVPVGFTTNPCRSAYECESPHSRGFCCRPLARSGKGNRTLTCDR